MTPWSLFDSLTEHCCVKCITEVLKQVRWRRHFHFSICTLHHVLVFLQTFLQVVCWTWFARRFTLIHCQGEVLRYTCTDPRAAARSPALSSTWTGWLEPLRQHAAESAVLNWLKTAGCYFCLYVCLFSCLLVCFGSCCSDSHFGIKGMCRIDCAHNNMQWLDIHPHPLKVFFQPRPWVLAWSTPLHQRRGKTWLFNCSKRMKGCPPRSSRD